jgi:putative membrane protein
MMGGGMTGYGGFGLLGGLLGLIINIGVIVGIIFLVVWAVRKFSSNGLNLNQGASTQSPREILQARYARGELTREQYQQMLNDLG